MMAKEQKSTISRITLLTLDFPPIIGGISRYLLEILSNMSDRVDILVIGLPAQNSEETDANLNVAVERMRLFGLWRGAAPPYSFHKFLSPFYLFSLWRMRKQTDIVLCGQAHYSILLPVWLMHKLYGLPYAVFTYGKDLLTPYKRGYGAAFGVLLRAARILFADSSAAADLAVNCGVQDNKITVVYPTIDAERLRSTISPESIRERYGLQEKVCILSVGRLVERKGFDMVIRALPQVLREAPNAHYLIGGTGSMESALRKLATDLDVQDAITFVGYIPDEELAAFYAASDIFTMVSREIPEKGDIEGFGIVYLEASLFGKPVVAGRSGGVPEAVIDQQTGLLVDPNDVNAIASAFTRLIRDPELAKRLGENGKNRVIREFNSRDAARKVLSVLRKAI